MKRKARVWAVALACVMLLASCGLPSPSPASSGQPSAGDAGLPPVPWDIAGEEEMLALLSRAMEGTEGFTAEERVLAAAAARVLSAPDYAEAIDHAARNYIETARFSLYLPDLAAEAASYAPPVYSGTIREARDYLDASLAAYDALAVRALAAPSGLPTPVVEISVSLERASEDSFRLGFDDGDVKALMWSMIDMIRAPFRDAAEASGDYQTARAAAVLREIYPAANALIGTRARDPDAVWFRPDRLRDYLGHMRILRCRREETEENDIYTVTAMLPLADGFLEEARALAFSSLEAMDHDARVPDIGDAFFDGARGLDSEALAYAGRPFELTVERRRTLLPERDDPIELWDGGDEPSLRAVCRFSPQLEETLMEIMAGAQRHCAEIADVLRASRYEEWATPKTQVLAKLEGPPNASLVLRAEGIQGYRIVLESLEDPGRKPFIAFVRGGETLTATLWRSDYRVTYTVGERWLGEPEGFGPAGRSVVPESINPLRYSDTEGGYRLTLYGETVGEAPPGETVP